MSFKIMQAVCDRLGGEMPVVRDEQVIPKVILINIHVGLILCDFMASRRFPKPTLRWWPPWATSPPSLQRLAMWETTRCVGIRQIFFCHWRVSISVVLTGKVQLGPEEERGGRGLAGSVHK